MTRFIAGVLAATAMLLSATFAIAEDWPSLDLPALVIHGSADRLVFPRGGRATARAIPGAKLRIYEGMGHDLPQQLWPQFAAEIDAVASRARP